MYVVIASMRRAAGESFDPQLFEVFETTLDTIRAIRDEVPG
jgi:response regulator RpfG family c-di-GMP phosphodiesterase